MLNKHTEMFKSQILSLVRSGHKIKELTKRYKLGHSTISRWLQAEAKAQNKSQACTLPKTEVQKNTERIRELEFEISKLLIEQEVIKTAISVLCKKKNEK